MSLESCLVGASSILSMCTSRVCAIAGDLRFLGRALDVPNRGQRCFQDVICVFQNFTCLRWIGVHQFTSNPANLLELPRDFADLVEPTKW